MTYVPDMGRALAAVGTTWGAMTPNGQTWHAPTAPAMTGHDYAELANDTLKQLTGGREGRPLRTMSMSMMRLGGLFATPAREAIELAYQNTGDYVFNSDRFEAKFGITPTPYVDGITATLQAALGVLDDLNQ